MAGPLRAARSIGGYALRSRLASVNTSGRPVRITSPEMESAAGTHRPLRRAAYLPAAAATTSSPGVEVVVMMVAV